MRVLGWQTLERNESEGWRKLAEVGSWPGNRTRALSTDHDPSGERFEYEHTCWDPKDGELCLRRVKPGETLVEARSDSDVQIDRQMWV